MVCSHVVSCLPCNVCCASPLTPYHFLPDVLLGSLAGELKQEIEARTTLVSVIGLGYVGLTLAVEKAKIGFKVLDGADPGLRRRLMISKTAVIHPEAKISQDNLQQAIPSFDLKRQNSLLQEEITAVLNEVIASGQFILGEHVKSVEEEIANLCGA